MKILLVGGGTSGHVLPTLSVGYKVQNLDSANKILYLGSTKLSDSKLVKSVGYKFIGIPAGKWRRYFDWRNFLDIFATALGLIVSLFIVAVYWPSKVFIKGGYVGVPVGLSAWILRRPIVLHESDSVLGAANKLLSRIASKICVSFPLDVYQVPETIKQKMIYTGVPVNDVFYSPKLGDLNISLKHDKPLILIMGGSQGARVINKIVKQALEKLLNRHQVVHLAGGLDYQMLKQWSSPLELNDYYLFDFLPNTQVASLMKKSSVIVSRAGATAIAEIAVSSKPAVLIPLKGSANNHQYCNALYLDNKGASVMIEQDNLTSELLINTIDKIIQSDLGKRLSFNISSFAKKDSADLIANLLLNNK